MVHRQAESSKVGEWLGHDPNRTLELQRNSERCSRGRPASICDMLIAVTSPASRRLLQSEQSSQCLDVVESPVAGAPDRLLWIHTCPNSPWRSRRRQRCSRGGPYGLAWALTLLAALLAALCLPASAQSSPDQLQLDFAVIRCQVSSVSELVLALVNPGCDVVHISGRGLALTRAAWTNATLAVMGHNVLVSRNVTIRGGGDGAPSTLLDCGYLKGRVRVAEDVTLTLSDLFLLNCRQPSAAPAAGGAVDLVSLEGDGSHLVVANATLQRPVCVPLGALREVLAAVPRPPGIAGVQGVQLGAAVPLCLPGLGYAPNCWNASLLYEDFAQNGTRLDSSGQLVSGGGGTVQYLNSSLVCGTELSAAGCAESTQGLEACLTAAASALGLAAWDSFDLPSNGTLGGGGDGGATYSTTSADSRQTTLLLAFVVPTVCVGWGIVLIIIGLLVWSQRRKSFSPCPEAVKEAYEGVVFVGLAEGSDEPSQPPTVGDGVAAVTVAGDAKRKDGAPTLLHDGADLADAVWGTTATTKSSPTVTTNTTITGNASSAAGGAGSSSGGGAGGPGTGAPAASPRTAGAEGDPDSVAVTACATLSLGGAARTTSGGDGEGAPGPSSTSRGGAVLQHRLLNDYGRATVPLHLVLGADVMVSGQQSLAGRGSFGTVLPGRYDKQPVAVRVFHRDSLGGSFEELQALKQDIEVLARHQHPNLVALLGAGEAPGGDELFVVEEPMVASLARVCHDGNGLSMERVLAVAMDISLGLAYLHPAVIHRNLRPASVLLDSSGTAKLTDFGLGRLNAAPNNGEGGHPELGSAQYMAPECFRGRSRRHVPAHKFPITPQSDIYSFGVLLWELLSRERPWRGMNAVQIALAVAQHNRRLDIPVNERFPPKIRKLIVQCWEQDPSKRPSAAEVAKRLGSMIQQHQQSQPSQQPQQPQQQQFIRPRR